MEKLLFLPLFNMTNIFFKVLDRVLNTPLYSYWMLHCVKSVHIRSYHGLCFPAFGLNTGRYGAASRIQSEWEKIWTRITPNKDTFLRSDMDHQRHQGIINWIRRNVEQNAEVPRLKSFPQYYQWKKGMVGNNCFKINKTISLVLRNLPKIPKQFFSISLWI